MSKFKRGDKVVYKVGGSSSIDWEDPNEDYCQHAGLVLGNTYTVYTADEDGTYVQIEEDVNKFFLHSDHFELASETVQPKQFPNGFESWHETHYEVCTFIGAYLHKWRGNRDGSALVNRYEAEGTGGMYDLAKEWTDEFEEAHSLEHWTVDNLDFFETIEEFLHNKNNKS